MAKQKQKPKRPLPAVCPCGAGGRYEACCGPLHEGHAPAADAVQLVRARFSAYVVGKPDYLWSTLHSGHDDRAQDREVFMERMQKFLDSARFRALRILDTRPPDAEGMACVLYAASIGQHNLDLSTVEQAYFVQEAGQWRYIAGSARPRKALSHALEHMTIDHWDCAGHHH